MQEGLRVLYNSDAVGYHYKLMSFEDTCRRAKVVAVARKFFGTKEAGMVLARREAQKKGQARSRLKRLFVRTLVPYPVAIKPLLDSQLSPCRGSSIVLSILTTPSAPAALQAGVEEDSAGE